MATRYWKKTYKAKDQTDGEEIKTALTSVTIAEPDQEGKISVSIRGSCSPLIIEKASGGYDVYCRSYDIGFHSTADSTEKVIDELKEIAKGYIELVAREGWPEIEKYFIQHDYEEITKITYEIEILSEEGIPIYHTLHIV